MTPTPDDAGLDVAEQAASQAKAAAGRAEAAQARAEQSDRGADRAEDGAGRAQAAAASSAREAEQSRLGAKDAEDGAGHAALAAAQAAKEIDPDDPLLDTAVRRIEAQVTEAAPFGLPGPPMNRRSPFRIGLHGALGVALAYGIVQAIVSVRSVLILLLIAGFLAIGLNPAVEFFGRRGLKRGRAVAVVLVLVLLAVGLFFLAIVPPIVAQSGAFVKEAPRFLTDLQRNRVVADLDKRFHLIAQAQAALQSPKLASNAFGGVLGLGKVVFSAVFSTITVLTLMLYFMSSLPSIKDGVYRLVPRSRRARFGLLTDDILGRVGGYVAGGLLVAACAGVTTYLVLLVAGVPYALPLAVVVTITDLVPVVGATIGAIIVTLVAFTVSLPVGIGVGVWYLAYQQLENFLIYPRVMKRSVNVAPAATVVAVLIGGSLLGILGALLAIPIAAALQLILDEVVIPKQNTT